MALVRLVAIPKGKMPRVQRVPSLPPFTCFPSSKSFAGGFEPYEGCCLW